MVQWSELLLVGVLCRVVLTHQEMREPFGSVLELQGTCGLVLLDADRLRHQLTLALALDQAVSPGVGIVNDALRHSWYSCTPACCCSATGTARSTLWPRSATGLTRCI